MRGKKVQFGNFTRLPHIQEPGTWVDCSWSQAQHEKPDLVCKSFWDMDINSNLNGANDHMIWLETDTKKIFDHEDDDEAFYGLIRKDILAFTANIIKLHWIMRSLLEIIYKQNNFCVLIMYFHKCIVAVIAVVGKY